jgi:hypothetical protein
MTKSTRYNAAYHVQYSVGVLNVSRISGRHHLPILSSASQNFDCYLMCRFSASRLLNAHCSGQHQEAEIEVRVCHSSVSCMLWISLNASQGLQMRQRR